MSMLCTVILVYYPSMNAINVGSLLEYSSKFICCSYFGIPKSLLHWVCLMWNFM